MVIFLLAGCQVEEEKILLPPTDALFQIEVDGIFREYQLYIPENTFEGAPLVVMLHGFTQTHLELQAISQMDQVADEHQFVVVYPLGTSAFDQPHWNAGLTLSQVDDVFFIETLIQTLQETYSLSEDAFVSGYSNGGFMAYTLMCESDRIKAIAPVAALMSENTFNDCDRPAEIPVLHIHGTDDFVVPAFNPMIPFFGFGGGPVLLDLMEHLRSEFDLPEFEESRYNERVTRLETKSPQTSITLYLIEGYPHVWPSARNVQTNDASFEASSIIWDYFSSWLD